MSRWLVTGSAGLLGHELIQALASETVTAMSREALDVTDAAAVTAAVAGHDIVINTAAWTDVDGAEVAESLATAVNGTGPQNLAAACSQHGAVLLHVSTDYVLSGGHSPYPEDSPSAPLNAYGRSKLVGERAVRHLLPDTGYVVRTAWLYGAHGANFVSTIARLLDERPTLEVVCDQFGQPTWAQALSQQLRDLGRAASQRQAVAGIYHGTAAGYTSWYHLARAICTDIGLDPDRIHPTTSAQFPRPAARPTYSVLGHSAWASTPVHPLGQWRPMLTEAIRHGAHSPRTKLTRR